MVGVAVITVSPLSIPLTKYEMVCAMWMWGMRAGLASVVPSFASWPTGSLPSIPVWTLTFCIIICGWTT